MKKQELIEKFGNHTIDALESSASIRMEAIKNAQGELIEILYYLRFTGRYRENDQYKTATFDEYLRGRFAPMTENKFNKIRRAYVHFPEQTSKYGPGVVMDAVAKCGLVGAGEAFKEAESSEYEGARFYQHLEQIIDKHTRAPETRHEPAPTRAELMNEVARLKQENMNLMSVISEQQEQINRLKKTVFEQA